MSRPKYQQTALNVDGHDPPTEAGDALVHGCSTNLRSALGVPDSAAWSWPAVNRRMSGNCAAAAISALALVTFS
jgi:hypothetical protein